ncbi:serine hydrolase domain-containing protein [Abyssalbus ytuae]|uniref:Beta-lactamase family protein n=1 Tax=Abyssalbus ytuae TaxID=2926907 RepID=A0A9E6ZPD8_9FLAO|nr:serine hydrolase [Abyssalbus ytuae]UOB16308.1 beta-lactamase family protein [Abyssalbus ytuae]
MLINQKILSKRTVLHFFVFFVLLNFTCCKKEVKPQPQVEEPQVEEPFSFPRSSPEEQGVSSQSIVKLLNEITKSEIQFHSIMILRHGNVIAEGWWDPYKPEYKHQLYSLSKSFTSTAVGLAVKEGLLSVNDKVVSFFPDEVPADIDPKMKELTVKHLLTMSTGHAEEPMAKMMDAKGSSWVKTFLSTSLENDPGTEFLYNTPATFMLSAIVQKVSGQKLIDFLKPRLFEPLDITEADWKENPQGINTGGYGLRVKTEDIAKLGQLYLQKGQWEGKEILTEQWVNEATHKQVDSKPWGKDYDETNDWAQGYGYQFWMCYPGGFRGDGAFGQFCIVMPEKDLVVAITSESFDMGKNMRLVWDNLLPGIQNEALPEDIIGGVEFEQALKNLAIPAPATIDTTDIISKISGKQYTFDENNEAGADTMFFIFKEEGKCTVIVNEGKETTEIDCGMNKWVVDDNEKKTAESLFPVPGGINFSSKIAANAVWMDSTTLQLTWRFLETVHGDKITCKFEGDDYEKVTLTFLNSVAEGTDQSDPRKPLTGQVGVKINRAK